MDFVTRTVKGDDPREFSHAGEKYQIAMDEQGNPIGVSWFAGPNPTFMSGDRVKAIGSKEFVKAAMDALGKTVEAFKAGRFESKVREGAKAGSKPRWYLKATA